MVGGGGGSSTRYRTPMMTSLPPASFSPHVHLNVFLPLTRLTLYLVRKLVWIEALILGNLRACRCLGIACLRQVSSAVVGSGRTEAARPKTVKRGTASCVRGTGVGAGAKQTKDKGGPAFLHCGVKRSASVLGTTPVRVRALSKQLVERSDLATSGGLVQVLR